MVEELGFKLVSELFYADYTDVNGVRVFKDIMDPGHESLSLFVLKV